MAYYKTSRASKNFFEHHLENIAKDTDDEVGVAENFSQNENEDNGAHATGRFCYVTAPCFIRLALATQWES